MDPEVARTRLTHMTQAGSVPKLTEGEIDTLLSMFARPDADGLAPSDPAWTPTYDLNGAAAEGWRWKAGKVAGAYSFHADGASFTRNQMHVHCIEQAKSYGARSTGSPSTSTVEPDLDDQLGNWNL